MNSIQIMTSAIHVAGRTADWINQHPPIRFEECARCHQMNRLVKVGKLWLQERHDCGNDFN